MNRTFKWVRYAMVVEATSLPRHSHVLLLHDAIQSLWRYIAPTSRLIPGQLVTRWRHSSYIISSFLSCGDSMLLAFLQVIHTAEWTVFNEVKEVGSVFSRASAIVTVFRHALVGQSIYEDRITPKTMYLLHVPNRRRLMLLSTLEDHIELHRQASASVIGLLLCDKSKR